MQASGPPHRRPQAQWMKESLKDCLHFRALPAPMLMQMRMTDWKMFSIPINCTLLLLPAVQNDQVQMVQTDLFNVQPVGFASPVFRI